MDGALHDGDARNALFVGSVAKSLYNASQRRYAAKHARSSGTRKKDVCYYAYGAALI